MPKPVSCQSAPVRSNQLSVSFNQLQSGLLPLFIEQIASAASDADDPRTAVSVLVSHHTFVAVVGVRDPRIIADDAFLPVFPKGTLIAHSYWLIGVDVGVAHWTFPVALLAEPADVCSGQLVAYKEIKLVARHGCCFFFFCFCFCFFCFFGYAIAVTAC